jgi:transmembrane sensor
MSKDDFSIQAVDITSEACAWIAQLETGDLSPADVEAFREWMQRSPRHRQEARRMARLSAELNILNDLEPALREAAGYYRPVTRQRSRGAQSNMLFGSSRFGVFSAVAAMLMVAVMVVLQMLQPRLPTTLETQVGAFSEDILDDGSIVKLNTNSRVDIAYSDHQRDIFLRRGEAFFEVAHDVERPFVVHVKGRTIRALGTAFAVRLNSEDMQVTVTEGVVELSEHPPTGEGIHKPVQARGLSRTTSDGTEQLIGGKVTTSPGLQAEIHAGQRLVLADRSRIPEISELPQEMIRRDLLWREGLFDFSNTPLKEVVREFERYTPHNIEIVDPALKEREFSGIFPTGDIDILLGALQSAYGIDVTYSDNGTIRLGSDPQG